MIPLTSLSVCPTASVVKGPERRRAPVANERPDWRGVCFEALDVPPIPQACSKGVGELASPAPLPSGERCSPFSIATSDEVMRLNTAWTLSPQEWRANQARRQVLRRQTERLAQALESNGVWVRKPVPISAIANVTGEVDDEESYRTICFLPLVAQRERKGMLNALRWFQKHDLAGHHLRYAVVTAGARVSAWGRLRDAITALHRRVSRWAHEAERDWGIEVIYRGTEFTRDQAATYHPHANILYRPRRRLNEARWAAFLSWSRSRLGAHWRDNGRLVKPDEAIKYPFKPAELDSAPAEELVWLWWETHRLKFAQPMGGFALFRKTLDAEGRKVVMVYRRHGARLEIVEKAKRDPLPEGRDGASQENTILCRTAPQFRFGPHAQPVTLVAHYTEKPRTPDGARRLAIIRDWNQQARQVWDINGGPDPQVARAIAAGQVLAFNVHTRRPTVQARGAA